MIENLKSKKEYYSRLGARLREARKSAGLTQKEICRLLREKFNLKYTQTMISKMECGKRGISHLYIEIICFLTNCNASYFLLINRPFLNDSRRGEIRDQHKRYFP